jgi:hypothetical protein
MILKTHLFLEGVSIGIEEAGRPEDRTLKLYAGEFLRERFGIYYLEQAWSDYIRQEFSVVTNEAQGEQTNEFEISDSFLTRELLASHMPSRLRFEREGLLELLTGAEAGILYSRPDISTRFSLSNWNFIVYVYPRLRRRYLQRGIAERAVPELFTRNAVALFLSTELARPPGYQAFIPASFPSTRLSLLSFFGFGERFGWLEIETSPTAARLTVDSSDWGTSPAGKGVRAGTHRITASKGWLSAEQHAEVKAGKSSLVELELAASPRL